MSHLFVLIVSTCIVFAYSSPVQHQRHNSVDLSTLTVVAPFNNINDVTKKKISQLINSKPFSIVPYFPDSGRQRAVLEYESSPISKVDTAYGNLQQFVAGLYHPKPIVDTISEYEKYGNDGGKSRSASVAVIAGVEGISNLLNAAVDIPFETVQQLTKKLSATASLIGAKFAGL